jgi:outer membrane immunogenic protein
MKLTTRFAVLAALTSIAGAASAADAPPPFVTASGVHRWEGFYAGINAGGAWSTTCTTWSANGPLANTAAFQNRDCPNNGTFVGGLQIGYNFQWQEWVWGFGVDYDFWSSKSRTNTLVYNGDVFPQGTYSFSGQIKPNGFAILGPRIGYAVNDWLPYFRVGGVFSSGSHDVVAFYTPTGAASPTASFNGGKNSKSNGFGVGGGVEYALADSWSLKIEYTYINLGKGSNSNVSCTGSAAACNAFANLSLDSFHNSFTASALRLGINYLF